MEIALLCILAAFLILAHRCIVYGYGRVVLWCALVGLGLPAALGLGSLSPALGAAAAVLWTALILGLPMYWIASAVWRDSRRRP